MGVARCTAARCAACTPIASSWLSPFSSKGRKMGRTRSCLRNDAAQPTYQELAAGAPMPDPMQPRLRRRMQAGGARDAARCRQCTPNGGHGGSQQRCGCDASRGSTPQACNSARKRRAASADDATGWDALVVCGEEGPLAALAALHVGAGGVAPAGDHHAQVPIVVGLQLPQHRREARALQELLRPRLCRRPSRRRRQVMRDQSKPDA
eukprot:scaffold2090_cov225-Prasinococcus_capsulatus_cf.AAC.28